MVLTMHFEAVIESLADAIALWDSIVQRLMYCYPTIPIMIHLDALWTLVKKDTCKGLGRALRTCSGVCERFDCRGSLRDDLRSTQNNVALIPAFTFFVKGYLWLY